MTVRIGFMALFIVLSQAVFFASAASRSNTPSCAVRPFEQLDLPAEAGQLLYLSGIRIIDAQLVSSSPQFSSVKTANNLILSPDTQLMASTEYTALTTYPTITFRNVSGDLIFVSPEIRNFSNMVWLSGNRLLTIVVYNRDQFYAFSVIYPLARTMQYVHPVGRATDYYIPQGFGTEGEIIPLFETYISDLLFKENFSPDGNYFKRNYQGILFDISGQRAEPLDETNFNAGNWIWAYTSDHLVRLEQVNGVIKAIVYELASDKVSTIAELTVEPQTGVFLDWHSWSPNSRTLMLLFYPQWQARDQPVGRHPQVMHLDIETGILSDTCMRLFQVLDEFRGQVYVSRELPPDFHWSLDGRYLAFYGLVAGRILQEKPSVYIYDNQTGDIYEVYRGYANIVGWAVNPS